MHQPVGYDGPMALDCEECGGRWPCSSASAEAIAISVKHLARRRAQASDPLSPGLPSGE
jgi:hypothetical protein